MTRLALGCATFLLVAAPLAAQNPVRPDDGLRLTPPKHVIAPKSAAAAPAVAPARAPALKVTPPAVRSPPKAVRAPKAVTRPLMPPASRTVTAKPKTGGEE